jgi:hypothetical protein
MRSGSVLRDAVVVERAEAMQLQIVIENFDPPSGRGVVDGHEAWTFAGWLELIEKVERLKEESASREAGAHSDRTP